MGYVNKHLLLSEEACELIRNRSKNRFPLERDFVNEAVLTYEERITQEKSSGRSGGGSVTKRRRPGRSAISVSKYPVCLTSVRPSGIPFLLWKFRNLPEMQNILMCSWRPSGRSPRCQSVLIRFRGVPKDTTIIRIRIS